MKLDTSGYYPKSHLDDEDEEKEIIIVSDDDVAVCVEEQNDKPVINPEPSEKETSPSEGNNFIDAVSHFLSWALVPMFMPVYGIIFSFGLTILAFTGFGTKLAFTAITFAFNVIVPAIIVLLLKRFGFIKDIGLNNQDERFLPYVVCILCLIGTALFMYFKGAPVWLVMFFFGGAAAGLAEVIINRWWKISVHAAGIAGIVALLLHLIQYEYVLPSTFTWLLISLGAAGLLGASRIWLARHTLWQVIAGYAVGFCSVYFLMLV